MAEELRVSYPAAATLYAILRRVADGFVFNGTAFVAWSDADIATYDIPLTSRGGDYYTGDLPDPLAAGNYSLLYYVQDGRSPATTDLMLPGGQDIYWTGSAVASESDVSVSAYALTSLASAKAHAGITSTAYDSVLSRIINGVSAEVERVAARQFKARDYRERCDGDFQVRLVLAQRPVQRVNRIAWGNDTALTVAYAGSAIDATAAVYDDPEASAGGGLRLSTITAAGAETNTSLSFATYKTVSTLVTAVNLLSGWTAALRRDVRTLDLFATGSEDAKSRTVELSYPHQRMDRYRVDHQAGTVEFTGYQPSGWWPSAGNSRAFGRDFQGVVVSYRAGYETVPADVELLANDLVKEAWLTRQQNTAAQSIALGPYSVTFGSSTQSRVRDRLTAGGYIDAGGYVSTSA